VNFEDFVRAVERGGEPVIFTGAQVWMGAQKS
jgi:hypothetical protein